MVLYHQAANRNKVLFVNSFSPEQQTAVKKYAKISGQNIEALVLMDTKKVIRQWVKEATDITLLTVDISDTEALQNCLKPYTDEILTATFLGDGNAPYFRKVIPLI